MNTDISHFKPVVALFTGVLILFIPKQMNYIVSIYLVILIGIIVLSHMMTGGFEYGHRKTGKNREN